MRYQVIPRTLSFIFHQDRVLMLKANKTKEWSGKYDPVGGHIEAGEDVMESGLREIKEESGLEVSDVKLRGVIHVTNFYENNIMLFVITAKALSCETISGPEGELKWIPVSKITKLNTFADIKPILERINRDNTFFTGISQFNNGDLISMTLS